MRLSAKFNVFLGVPNLTEEFLPDGLAFLKSYFRKRPMNLLFPVSITASTIATWLLVDQAISGTTGLAVAGFTMLAALMALAVLEHWFLVLPLPVATLWRWGLTSRTAESSENATGNDHGGLAQVSPAWAKAVVKHEAPLMTLPGR
jgi:putative photosynthetic complex assembly protein 2